jgi:Mlc titration factor MtfA (ptsG expression regulator)
MRRRYLDSHDVPEDLWAWTVREHPIIAQLPEAERDAARRMSTLFLHEKTFEAADGIELNDTITMSIASQAVIPILQLGIEWYENWSTVVVVPRHFRQAHASRDAAGVVHEWTETDAGLSWSQGPVVLSWEDVEASGWLDGFNVVIHEAAHRLDLTDGSVNGRPALHRGMSGEEWFRVCSSAYSDLAARVSSRRPSSINPYAAESDGEFFAVMSENFFERPRRVRSEYPDVYRLFVEFYRQDPASRTSAQRRIVTDR